LDQNGGSFLVIHFFIVRRFSGWVFSPFFRISSDFLVFRISGGPFFSVFGGSVFGIRGPKKGSKKPSKRVDFVKKGGLSIVTHFYIVRRFSGGVFLGWGSFGVWGKRWFSGF